MFFYLDNFANRVLLSRQLCVPFCFAPDAVFCRVKLGAPFCFNRSVMRPSPLCLCFVSVAVSVSVPVPVPVALCPCLYRPLMKTEAFFKQIVL